MLAEPFVRAVAFRVRDAAKAHKRALSLGGWETPTHAGAMELNIPGIHGVGDSVIYLVDRYGEDPSTTWISGRLQGRIKSRAA